MQVKIKAFLVTESLFTKDKVYYLKMLQQYWQFLTEIIYRSFENADVVKIASDRRIKIDFVIAAGCHNGSDTVNIMNSLNPLRYLAFEPDSFARIQAEKTFLNNMLIKVELHPQGLSNVNSQKHLKYEAEGKGSGSTHLSDFGEDQVEVLVFDEHFKVTQNSGLLWLDVEGHALQALEGMKTVLKKIAIARIEVQLHTRNDEFAQDFMQVIEVMREASLVPCFGPIRPGYFGEIIFINSKFLSSKDKLQGKILWIVMKLLHLTLYLKLNKLPTINLG